MKITALKVNNQYQILDDRSKYLASIYRDPEVTTYIGDLYDVELGGVLVKFHHPNLENVILAVAKYNSIKVSKDEISFLQI